MEQRNLTAAELIKRFREEKPTSREDREKRRHNAGVSSRMWWEEDDGEEPRPNPQPTAWTSKKNYVEENEEIDDPIVSLKPSRFDDVNSLREREIRSLEKEIQRREGLARSAILSSSFNGSKKLKETSLDDSGDWFGIGRPRGSIESLPRVSIGVGGLGDFGFGGGETLGSTGVLGLLKNDLRLDGRAIEEDNKAKEEKKASDLNASLEELLKNLNANQGNLLIEESPSSIPEITNKLNTEIMDLLGYYETKEKEEKESKKKEESLREEGREEERKKQLLSLLDESPTKKVSFLDKWVPDKAANKTAEEVRIDGVLGEGENDSPPPNNNDEVILSRIACENELEKAEQTFLQMRTLHKNLRRQAMNLRKKKNSTDVPSSSSREGAEIDLSYLYADSPSTVFTQPALMKDSTMELNHRALNRAAKTITSNLDAALQTLQHRLPEKEDKPDAIAASSSANTTSETVKSSPTGPSASLTADMKDTITTPLAALEVKSLPAEVKEPSSEIKSTPPLNVKAVSTNPVKEDLEFIDKVLGSEKVSGTSFLYREKKSPHPSSLLVAGQARPSANNNINTMNNTSSMPGIVPPTLREKLRSVMDYDADFFPSAPPASIVPSYNQTRPIAESILIPPQSRQSTMSIAPISIPAPPISSSLPPTVPKYNKDMENFDVRSAVRRPLEGASISHLREQFNSYPNYTASDYTVYHPPAPATSNEPSNLYAFYERETSRGRDVKIPTLPSSQSDIIQKQEFLMKMRALRENVSARLN